MATYMYTQAFVSIDYGLPACLQFLWRWKAFDRGAIRSLHNRYQERY
jgi:hypothetical protein